MESRLEEPVFENKTNLAAKQKQRIAEEAYSLIEPDEAIYLNGGSTTLFLARLLRERTDLTVVTNSLQAAIELADSGPRVILIGGELRRISQTMVGPLTSRRDSARPTRPHPSQSLMCSSRVMLSVYGSKGSGSARFTGL